MAAAVRRARVGLNRRGPEAWSFLVAAAVRRARVGLNRRGPDPWSFEAAGLNRGVFEWPPLSAARGWA